MDAAGMSIDFAWPTESPLSHDNVPIAHRRLSDKVLMVFHHACDARDLEAADTLLGLLEVMTMRGPRPETGNRRLDVDSLVNAHERLWQLHNPGRT